MIRIAMLGSGFIGRFYAESIQGQRSKDKIVSIYARKEENAYNFVFTALALYGLCIKTTYKT